MSLLALRGLMGRPAAPLLPLVAVLALLVGPGLGHAAPAGPRPLPVDVSFGGGGRPGESAHAKHKGSSFSRTTNPAFQRALQPPPPQLASALGRPTIPSDVPLPFDSTASAALCFVFACALSLGFFLRGWRSTWRHQSHHICVDHGQTILLVSAAVDNGTPATPPRNEQRFLALTTEELASIVGGRGRVKTIWDDLKQGVSPFAEGSASTTGVSPAALAQLRPYLRSPSPACTTVVAESRSSCGTLKFLQSCAGSDHLFESVLIPHATLPRTTLCVSSQVGCNRGCAFCATGRMGLLRNLTADEILSQVFHGLALARREGMPPLTNVVFMGMGDAGCNVPAVTLAVHALTDPLRFAFAPSRCTVSTVGPAPAVFRPLAELPASLAWSLHAAEDGLRRQLVPSTRHSTAELRDALLAALLSRPSKRQVKVMVAITMLQEVNDREQDAEALAQFLQPLRAAGVEVALDLIPYNDTGLPEFRRSPDDWVKAFAGVLRQHGYHSSIRVSRGEGEAAACGQLATHPTRSKRGDPVA